MHFTTFLLVTLLSFCLPRPSRGILGYGNITSPLAICNDFSRAGMFTKKISTGSGPPKKWIIFLESGGFCHSAESCNKRFFRSEIRNGNQGGGNRSSNLLPEDFNLTSVWSKYKDGDLSNVVSPLMTSMHRFRGLISDKGQFVIDGTDILSEDCGVNPVFCEHQSVVLPYCSSDLWLGNDFRIFTTKSKYFT